jgi:hypothetical protein
MKHSIQTFLAEAGEAACYALDIIKIAEIFTRREFDPLTALQRGIETGFIKYDPQNPHDNDNFYVNDPANYLGLLTGELWTVTKEAPDYRPMLTDWVVERWERMRGQVTTSHFRLPDWDSLYDSQTVKFGKIASLRVFRRA